MSVFNINFWSITKQFENLKPANGANAASIYVIHEKHIKNEEKN